MTGPVSQARGLAEARPSLPNQLAQTALVARWFGPRAWLVSMVAALATLALIGLPTRLIPNPFFTRMTPTRPQDYVIWVATAALAGLIAGTFVLSRRPSGQVRLLSGGLLSFLAVGCPVCNKLVVLLLGTSGALGFFAPAQLYLGLGALAMLAVTLHLRVRALTRLSCDVPQPEGGRPWRK